MCGSVDMQEHFREIYHLLLQEKGAVHVYSRRRRNMAKEFNLS
jgi:hypothetical protein